MEGSNAMTDVSLGSDGVCTGFPDSAFGFDWSACCLAHDLGSTDGMLLDCLQSSVPPWAWPAVGFAITIMIFWRPVYNLLQRWGWLK